MHKLIVASLIFLSLSSVATAQQFGGMGMQPGMQQGFGNMGGVQQGFGGMQQGFGGVGQGFGMGMGMQGGMNSMLLPPMVGMYQIEDVIRFALPGQFGPRNRGIR